MVLFSSTGLNLRPFSNPSVLRQHPCLAAGRARSVRPVAWGLAASLLGHVIAMPPLLKCADHQ
jgi:hypothetical protein